MDQQELINKAKQLKIELARDSLYDFVTYTKPDYTVGWFNQFLCAKLDQFIQDVEDGKFPKLIICAPPRSGKSEIASRRFPAYALGKKPGWKFIACSYAASLANDMSTDCKDIMMDEAYHDIFPDIHLDGSDFSDKIKSGMVANKIDKWEIMNADGEKNGSVYVAAGVNGPITGKGFNIGVIDDPAKDYQEASSPVYQARVMDWFKTTFRTRRDPLMHGILIILTRWHPMDLAGQLLAEMKEGGLDYELVSFPLLAEEDEVRTLGDKTYRLRNKGDILFPERMPLEYVNEAKAESELTWNALYQQRPTMKGGSLFKDEYWQYYDILPRLQYIKMYADTAMKKEESNDYSVFQVWGKAQDTNEVYLIDQIRGKWEAPELKTTMEAYWSKWKSFTTPYGTINNRGIAIEDKASGTGLIQTLKKEKKIVLAEPLMPQKDKISRANDVIPYIKTGMVHIPSDKQWLHDYKTEFANFNAQTVDKVKDDQIDVTVYAITDMLIGTGAEPNIRFIG